MNERRFRLFVYGTMLSGEPDHELLARARLVGPARTAQGYTLVELGALAGLVEESLKRPEHTTVGELYEVVYETIAMCDKHRDHPRLYHRAEIPLADGSRAFAYLLRPDQVRGKRRIRHGDWRRRFEAQSEREVGPFVRWARSRHKR